MTFVVGENCIKCKHTDCVEVCPVDCFYEGPNFLVINPDECIDCALCEPECPVDAIFSEDELPEDQQEYLELNAQLSEKWENITESTDPMPDHEEWAEVKNKIEHHRNEKRCKGLEKWQKSGIHFENLVDLQKSCKMSLLSLS